MSMLINTKYYGLWKDWKFELSYEECGYESGNAELNISLLGLHSVFRLPWKSKRFPYGDCDAPKWGIAIHSSHFWLYKGGKGNMNGGSKWWAWELPFFSKIHVKHLVDTTDGMVDEKELEGKNPYVYYADNPRVNKYHYLYTDSYDGQKIDCEYWQEYREWRPKWLTWTKLFATKRDYIEIEFKKEVGKKKGSWKGGCVGCSYNMLPWETPLDTIQRMEKEREFQRL